MVKYDKIVLVKEYGNLKKVGEVFEIANITDTAYIIRDAVKRVAVATIAIDDFDTYFVVKDKLNSWTSWTPLSDKDGVIAFYRTNCKKVQIKLHDGTRAEATCNKSDTFDLRLGINIAYLRCLNKMYWKMKSDADIGINNTALGIKELIKRVKPLEK